MTVRVYVGGRSRNGRVAQVGRVRRCYSARAKTGNERRWGPERRDEHQDVMVQGAGLFVLVERVISLNRPMRTRREGGVGRAG